MVRMITIPLLILVGVILYVVFEVQLAQALAWVSGDGMLNLYALSRLEYHEEKDRILELSRNEDPKTRLFALKSLDSMKELGPVPKLIKDPNWEVRMEAIRVAAKHRHKDSGTTIAERLLDYDPFGARKRRAQFERKALMEALEPVSSRLNAESLSRLAISTSTAGKVVRSARRALWSLGPIAEGEETYRALLENAELYQPTFEDLRACLVGAAAIQYDGALQTLIRYTRAGPGGVRANAVAALGLHGGPVARRMLQELAKDPAPNAYESPINRGKRLAAKLALLQLEAREKGLPVPKSLEDAEKRAETDDLLASYGSNGAEPGEAAAPEKDPAPPSPDGDEEEAPGGGSSEQTTGEPAIEDEDDLLAAYGTRR